MTRTPQLWRTRTKARPLWLYFRCVSAEGVWPARIAHAISGKRYETETVPTEPERLIPAGKVRIEHTDIPYYIEGRL